MNFEHLYKKLLLKYPSKKKKIIYLIEYFRIKSLLIQKLKLGLIVFEVKEFFFAGFKIYEFLEMKYARQDNTFSDSIKLENRLKSLSWKWNFSNILSLFLILFFFFIFIYIQTDYWLTENLYFIFKKDPRYDYLMEYSLKNSLQSFFTSSTSFKNINTWLIDIIINFCSLYEILQ